MIVLPQESLLNLKRVPELRERRQLSLRLITAYQLTLPPIMNSFRIARAALRARPAAFSAPLQRRGYADAVADKVRI